MTRARNDAGAATRGWLLLVVPTSCLVLLYSLLWLVVMLLGGTFLLQLEPIVLTSGSMEPGAARGDVVLLDPYDGGELDVGTVITFDDPANAGHLVTHRIDRLLPDGTYRTKGDANRGPDSTPVPPDTIAGTGRLLVPLVALPVTWAQDGQYHLLLALAAVIGVAALGARLPEDPADAGTAEQAVPTVRITPPSHVPDQLPPLWGPATFTSRKPPVTGRSEAEMGEEPQPTQPPTRPSTQQPVFDLQAGVWHARQAPPPFRARLTGARRALTNVGAVLALAASLSLAPGERAWAALRATTVTTGSWTAATIASPTGLAGAKSCLLTNDVTLTWVASASSGVDGYEVWRSTTSGGPYSLIGTTGPLLTTYTDSGLTAGNSYYYVVTATDDPWRSSSSGEVAILSLCL